MTDTTARMTGADFERADGLEGWRVLDNGAYLHIPTGSFAESARLVHAIAELPGVDRHPPAVDLRAAGVTVRVITVADDYFGMSEADVDLARRIAQLVRDFGLHADPSALQNLLVVPGAPAGADITPFWRAALGYDPRPDSPDEDLVDPRDRGPAFWFESMEQPRPDGGGAIHLGIWVPRELAEERVAAALAAGGRLVRDDWAPAWWTLADAAGNEADIATIAHRE
jgi:4a-hydroxytetrahydrobiopterin dehydratase